jgi:hypothetical protein
MRTRAFKYGQYLSAGAVLIRTPAQDRKTVRLLDIPEAEKGWPAAQRVHWFRTFAMNVSQIHDGEGEMDEPVELKIELEKPLPWERQTQKVERTSQYERGRQPGRPLDWSAMTGDQRNGDGRV